MNGQRRPRPEWHDAGNDVFWRVDEKSGDILVTKLLRLDQPMTGEQPEAQLAVELVNAESKLHRIAQLVAEKEHHVLIADLRLILDS